MKYTSQIDEKFKYLIESQFGDYLVVSFITGRGAFQISDPEMDIDTFVILDDSILKAKNIFKKKWVQYVKGYRDIHQAYGLQPDNVFPGDFVTVSQAYDVMSGRGFVNKNGQIYLQPMTSIADESNENDYRIFRSMIIIGRYLSGNESFLNEIKSLSLICLIKYLFIKKSILTVDSIIIELLSGREKELYGFDKRYEPHFSRYMKPFIEKTLIDLANYSYIKRVRSKTYKAQSTLYDWGEIVTKRNWSAEHLLSFQDTYYRARCKEIFSVYNSASHWEKLKKHE